MALFIINCFKCPAGSCVRLFIYGKEHMIHPVSSLSSTLVCSPQLLNRVKVDGLGEVSTFQIRSSVVQRFLRELLTAFKWASRIVDIHRVTHLFHLATVDNLVTRYVVRIWRPLLVQHILNLRALHSVIRLILRKAICSRIPEAGLIAGAFNSILSFLHFVVEA